MFKGQMLIAATFSPEAIEIEAAKLDHPNEMKFSGTLVQLDAPSTKPPNGSNGHRILIPKALAEKTYKTLIGMGVNYSTDLEKHQPTRKVGVIKKAWIDGSAIKVSDIIWKKDFPDAEKDLKKANLGMSFEASDIGVEDPDADIWRLSNLCFTGAAILYKASAAYYKTEALAASSMSAKLIKTNNGGAQMAKVLDKKKKPSVAASGDGISVDTLVAAMTRANKPILDALNSNTAGLVGLKSFIEASQADALEARGKKALKKDDEDDEDDDMESAEDDMESAKDKKDDEDDDEDGDEMDSSANDDADDGDDLEDLDDSDDEDDDDTGHINKDAIKEKKGNKTTVSTKGDKNKTVVASGGKSFSKLSALVDKLIASGEEDKKTIKQLTKKLAAQSAQIEAAAESTGRRSVTISAGLQTLLSKEGLDTSTLSASGEKITAAEFDIMADKGQLSTVQRVAMKTEAARIGLMDEGIVRRS